MGGLLVIFTLSFALFGEKMLAAYAKFFTVNTATKGADAIYILGGNPKTRPAKAIELVKEGYASRVLMTKIKDKALRYRQFFIPEENLTAMILQSEQIPLTIIPPIDKEGATSTFDEAYALARYAKKHKFKHIIIVTDAFHTRRALYAFKKVFSLQHVDTKVEVAPAYNAVYREDNWWKTERGLRSYIIEPIKFLFYIFNTNNLKNIDTSIG